MFFTARVLLLMPGTLSITGLVVCIVHCKYLYALRLILRYCTVCIWHHCVCIEYYQRLRCRPAWPRRGPSGWCGCPQPHQQYIDIEYMEQTVSMILYQRIGIEYATNHHQQYMDMPQTITMTTLPRLFLGWFFEHRQTQDRAKVRLNHQRHYKMWRINGSTKYIKPAEDSSQVVPCQSPRKSQFFFLFALTP